MNLADGLKIKHYYVHLFILLIAALFLWQQFNQDQYLRGPDAYYYALQGDYWATTGEVKIPDSSFVHRINGQLQKFGLTTESAVRTWLVVSLFLLSAISVILFKKSGSLVSTLFVAWLLTSPSLLFVAIEFQKMFAFLIVIPFILFFLQRKPPYNLYAILPLGVALFMHKAAIPIVGLLTGFLLLENYRLFFRNQRNLLIVFGLSIGTVTVYFMLGDHFHILDLSRLGGMENLSPGIVTLMTRDALPVAIKTELMLSLLLYVCVLIWYLKTQNRRIWIIAFTLGLIVPGIFPFSANEVLGIGERYAIFLPYFFVLSSLLLISSSNLTLTIKPVFMYSSLGVVLIITSMWRVSYSHPDSLDPDNAAYEKVTSAISKKEIPMLIVHRGLNFYYKFKTHKESFHYEPEKHWDKMKIWRLTYRITANEFNYFLPTSCNWDSNLIENIGTNDYFLIREDCWVKFRSGINQENNQELYERVWSWWRNPAKTRPAFLYRKHKTEEDKNDPFSTFKK